MDKLNKKKLIKKCLRGNHITPPISLHPIGYNSQPKQISKEFWNKLDNVANNTEKSLGVTGLGLMGATIIAPNPYTLGAAYVNSLASGAIDVYLIARALHNKNYKNAGKNFLDLGLSLLGAKFFKQANKLKQANDYVEAPTRILGYMTDFVGNRLNLISDLKENK